MYFGNRYLDQQIVYEFDFKQTIDKLKYAIKRAILRFLDKVERWLDKHKDSKLKSWCTNLIHKIRSLIVKCDSIETESDARKLSEELNDYSSEFDEKTKVQFKHTDVHLDSEDLDKIRKYLDKEIDFSLSIEINDNEKELGSHGYDLEKVYKSVYQKGKYCLTQIQLSIKNILQDKLFSLPCYIHDDSMNDSNPEQYYTNIRRCNYFYLNFDKDDKLSFHYAKKIEDKFKPLKYRGQTVEKYFKDAKEFIIQTALEYAKAYEKRFNLLVRDLEIEFEKKESNK